MISIPLEKKIYKNTITGIISFTVIYFTPILSHLLPIPVSLFEPMRIVIFAGYFYTRSGINSNVLALTLPLFSFWVTGHPAIIKSFIISTELMASILILELLTKKLKLPLFVTISLTIVLSKIIYYGIKIILTYLNILNGPIISTSIINQIFTVVLISTCFTIVLNILNKRKENNAR